MFLRENSVIFKSLIHESYSKSYYLVSLNPVFHGLSFGIKFMISLTRDHRVTTLYFLPEVKVSQN